MRYKSVIFKLSGSNYKAFTTKFCSKECKVTCTGLFLEIARLDICIFQPPKIKFISKSVKLKSWRKRKTSKWKCQIRNNKNLGPIFSSTRKNKSKINQIQSWRMSSVWLQVSHIKPIIGLCCWQFSDVDKPFEILLTDSEKRRSEMKWMRPHNIFKVHNWRWNRTGNIQNRIETWNYSCYYRNWILIYITWIL